MNAKKLKSHCPVNFTLEIFGDKWTLLIIRDMLLLGKRYYGEFMSAEENIATNILADRLSMLEREGFVLKTRDEQHGSKYVYTPTQKALDLLPILVEMILWGAKYDPDTAAPISVVARIKRDKIGYMKEVVGSLNARRSRQNH
jgi:DNA-binding HxlR family transcriptional regulator